LPITLFDSKTRNTKLRINMGFLKSLSKYCILKKVRDKADEPEEK
jgi:hypothetical protein